MLRIGIVIDNWKLQIFDRHLSEAGFAYEKVPGVSADTTALLLDVESLVVLEGVVRAAYGEAAMVGGGDERTH